MMGNVNFYLETYCYQCFHPMQILLDIRLSKAYIESGTYDTKCTDLTTQSWDSPIDPCFKKIPKDTCSLINIFFKLTTKFFISTYWDSLLVLKTLKPLNVMLVHVIIFCAFFTFLDLNGRRHLRFTQYQSQNTETKNNVHKSPQIFIVNAVNWLIFCFFYIFFIAIIT